MKSRGLSSGGVPVSLILLGLLALLPLCGSVGAATPVVSISPGSVKIQVTSASVADAVDALSHAAGFKVTYEGARPSGMIFNSEINTSSVAETLFRLLDGQNINYGVVFDLSGRLVTSLMVLGPATKSGALAPANSGAAPRQFTPPRNPRNDLPPVDDDPAEEAEPEPPPPEPAASVSPEPAGSPVPPGGRTVPLPPSPFSPRPLVVSPFAPRPTPSPSP